MGFFDFFKAKSEKLLLWEGLFVRLESLDSERWQEESTHVCGHVTYSTQLGLYHATLYRELTTVGSEGTCHEHLSLWVNGPGGIAMRITSKTIEDLDYRHWRRLCRRMEKLFRRLALTVKKMSPQLAAERESASKQRLKTQEEQERLRRFLERG